tara:strand:- start:134 stop:313 length:180 start_codon:yes stop_codon:yes gene_type:complete
VKYDIDYVLDAVKQLQYSSEVHGQFMKHHSMYVTLELLKLWGFKQVYVNEAVIQNKNTK